MRRVIKLAAAALVGASLLTGAASAGTVAKYGADFTLSGAPKAGWSYSWNSGGAIETQLSEFIFQLNAGNLTPLVRDTSGNFETVANSAYPDPAPGVRLAATPTSLTPGQSGSEDANSTSRWAVATYTIQPGDTANGNHGSLDKYSFGTSATSTDGLTARVYVNGFKIFDAPLPPNFTYFYNSPQDMSQGGYAPDLGDLKVGDTISVAIGAGGTSTNDAMALDYQITLTPEPGSLMLAGVGMMFLARRRRR